MKKHIAIYCRISSRKQNMRSQEPDLERWASAQDDPVRWYRDSCTGTTMQRPQWQKLEEAIRLGQVKAVVCWRIDRLGRTAKGLTALFEDLQRHKVNLVSIKDGIDLNTAAGRMVANVLASIAQFESELRGERVLAGIAAAKAAGKKWGGSKPGFIRKLHPAVVKTVLHLHRQGEPITRISRATHLSRTTIYKVLKSSGIRGQK